MPFSPVSHSQQSVSSAPSSSMKPKANYSDWYGSAGDLGYGVGRLLRIAIDGVWDLAGLVVSGSAFERGNHPTKAELTRIGGILKTVRAGD